MANGVIGWRRVTGLEFGRDPRPPTGRARLREEYFFAADGTRNAFAGNHPGRQPAATPPMSVGYLGLALSQGASLVENQHHDGAQALASPLSTACGPWYARPAPELHCNDGPLDGFGPADPSYRASWQLSCRSVSRSSFWAHVGRQVPYEQRQERDRTGRGSP